MIIPTASPATLEEFLARIGELFEKDMVETTARETQFVQRTSKLTGHLFLTTYTFGVMLYKTPTLEQLTSLINQVLCTYGEQVSRIGLHERINAEAVTFFTAMLSHVIRLNLPSSKTLKVLTGFREVIILDSTSFQVPANLVYLFAGSGGKASEAGMKIQFGYDLKSFRLFYRLHAGNRPDNQVENSFVEELSAGSLRLTDLGYFVLDSFARLAQQGAYFLSRLKSGVTVYRRGQDGELEPIDMVVDLKRFLKTTDARWDVDVVLLAGETAIVSRLIVERLPATIIQQRIRRLNQRNRKKGRQTTPRATLWASVNCYITNTSAKTLPAKWCRVLYSIRWQVELLFKLWKSEFALDRIDGQRKERVLCTLYAKLFGIFVTSKLVAWARNTVWNTSQREVSVYRAAKLLQTFLPRCYQAMLLAPATVVGILREAMTAMMTCLKGPQQTRRSPCEMLEEACG